MSILLLIHSEYILVARRSHSNGDVVRHLGFLDRFFAYWRSIREVYSVIDRLHVTGFIQSGFDILVRGEIKTITCTEKRGKRNMSGLSHYISNIIEDAVPRSAERSPHQGNTCVKIGKTRFLRRIKKEFFNVLPVLRHYSECCTT